MHRRPSRTRISGFFPPIGIAKLAIAGTVFLSLWSAAHRLRITCYDLGLRADARVAALVYAGALAGTAAAVFYLLEL